MEKARVSRRGFMGGYRYEVVPQDNADGLGSVSARATLWTLARFAEYAGVGQGTTYGFGRVRVLRDGDAWSNGVRLSAWDRLPQVAREA